MGQVRLTARRAMQALAVTGIGVATSAHAQEAAQPTIALETITIEGERTAQQNGETARGPVNGFVAKKSATGTKTDTPLIETPQSISVVPADMIEAQQAQTTPEALRYTSGVLSEQYGADPRTDWIKVRGFQVPDFLDGMAVPRGTYAWGRIEPYFLERIEVLKGPASVLYGQTPPGGLVNKVSKLPLEEAHGEVRLTIADPMGAQAAFDFGGPADPDGKFFYRAVGVGRIADTEVDHVNDDQIAIAPSVTWKPTDSTTLTLLGHYMENDTKSMQFLPASGTLFPNPNWGTMLRSTFLGDPDYDDFDLMQAGAGYLFEHEFDNNLIVRQNLRYAEVDYGLDVIRGVGYADEAAGDIRTRRVEIYDDVSAFTVDNQAEFGFDTGPVSHRVLAGLDYRKHWMDYTFDASPMPGTGIANPWTGAQTLPGAVVPVTSTDQETGQLGLYLQDQMKIDRLTILASARHDWVEGESINRLNNTVTDIDDSDSTWRVGAIYNFDNGIAPYASYSTSFVSNVGVLTSGDPFAPTTGDQFEAGIKYQPADWGNSLITFSVFNITQQDVITTYNLVTTQTGEVEVRGAELEVRSEITDNLTLLAAYTYLDSEITESSIPDEVGKELAITPRHSASAWLEYEFDSGFLTGLTVAGGVRFVGESYADNVNSLETDSYTLFDAAVRYDLANLDPDLEGAELAVNASNLFDEEYVSSCNGLTACYWGNSRTVRATLSYRW